MHGYRWNSNKDQWLRENRGIGFEQIVRYIEGGKLLNIVDHPNQQRYPGQRMFVVKVDGYVYLVPFVEDDIGYFLKTIMPSRKATRDYLKGDAP